jgi:hypothetical protein
MKRSLRTTFAFAAAFFGSVLAASAAAQAVPATPDPALAAVFAEQTLPQTDLMPKPVLKCGPICTSIHRTSATISGSGADCTSAQNSLNSQLQNIASGNCVNDLGFIGSCNVIIHDTTSCTLIAPGTYQVQGYATYNCRDTNC